MRQPDQTKPENMSFLQTSSNPLQNRKGVISSMKMLKVAKNCTIPKENVKYITDFRSRAIWALVREKREKGQCLNLAGKKKTNAVVHLKSGDVLTTDTLLDTLLARMEKEGDDD